MCTYLFTYLFITFTICSVKANPLMMFSDPVKYEINELINCEPNSIWKWQHNTRFRDENVIVLAGNGTIDRNFDDNLAFFIALEQWKDNSWKTLVKLTKGKACTTIKTVLGDTFVLATKVLGVPSAACPITKRDFDVKDFEVDVRDTIAAKFMPGKFKGSLKFTDKQKNTLLCGTVTVTATKK